MADDTQRHAYFITINNPIDHGFSHDEIKRILVEKFTTLDYFCLSDEIGKQGTYHTHMYTHTTSRVRFSTYKRHFPTANIQEAGGTAQQARDYIKKSGKHEGTDKAETSVEGTFYEWGTMPTSKGIDPDMQELYRLVEAGYSNAEILVYNHDFIHYIDTIDKLRKTLLIDKYKGHRRLDLKVHYIFGPSGTGKTRFVLDTHGDSAVYRVTDYDHPYDSYSMQEVICYDEFRSSLKVSHMLDALDIYPQELPARYSNRYACYNEVYIVSNWQLEDQYKDVQISHPTTWQAFLRRIHTVSYFGKEGVKTYNSVDEYFARQPGEIPNPHGASEISNEEFNGLFNLIKVDALRG